MSKIVDFESAKTKDDMLYIELENTPKMQDMGHKMTEAMVAANMTGEQIEAMTDPIFSYISQCRHDAFMQGYNMSMKILKEIADEMAP